MPAFFLSIQRLFRSRRGQGMVEYGLIIGLVAVGVIVVLGLMRGEIVAMFNAIVAALQGTPRP
jgi:pilus assembly protein Flp/PilA